MMVVEDLLVFLQSGVIVVIWCDGESPYWYDGSGTLFV